MPREWHDRHSANKIEDEKQREFYRSIVADKKPYFMRYIYPALMKQYNTYIKNTGKNSLREFQMTISELKELPWNQLSDRQKDFLIRFDRRMPVGVGDCIMNKICRRFEAEFDGYTWKHNSLSKFDYRIMKSDYRYSQSQFDAIKKLYEDFNKRLRNYVIFTDYERVDECDSIAELAIMNDDFRRECSVICPNRKVLCNIVLDLCYTKNSTKKFAWSMCGQDIIHNLLTQNNNTISFPVIDDNGYIKYCGEKFKMTSKKIGVNE